MLAGPCRSPADAAGTAEDLGDRRFASGAMSGRAGGRLPGSDFEKDPGHDRGANAPLTAYIPRLCRVSTKLRVLPFVPSGKPEVA